MQSGPIHSLYSLYICVYRPLPPKEKRQWLLQTFTFWSNDGNFDAKNFVSWHQSVNFIDQEIWFRELNLDEQKKVLKEWALQPQLNFTPQLSSSSSHSSPTLAATTIPKFLPELNAMQSPAEEKPKW